MGPPLIDSQYLPIDNTVRYWKKFVTCFPVIIVAIRISVEKIR